MRSPSTSGCTAAAVPSWEALSTTRTSNGRGSRACSQSRRAATVPAIPRSSLYAGTTTEIQGRSTRAIVWRDRSLGCGVHGGSQHLRHLRRRRRAGLSGGFRGARRRGALPHLSPHGRPRRPVPLPPLRHRPPARSSGRRGAPRALQADARRPLPRRGAGPPRAPPPACWTRSPPSTAPRCCPTARASACSTWAAAPACCWTRRAVAPTTCAASSSPRPR